MKLYCYHTPAYADIFEDFFLGSLRDSYEVMTRTGQHQGELIGYQQESWDDVIREKVAYIIEALEENQGTRFLFSDPDVQFFRPTERLLLDLSRDYDLAFQQADPWAGPCTGFFVCSSNEATRRLWQDVALLVDRSTDDQGALHRLIHSPSPFERFARRVLGLSLDGRGRSKKSRSNVYGVSWRLLPLHRFFLAGAKTGRIWTPGTPIRVPGDIAMHHASWVVGKDHKVAQMRYVRQVVAATEGVR